MINLPFEAAAALTEFNTQYLAASDENSQGLALIFLLSGPVFFMTIYTIYRNKDKRHRHEVETSSEIANVQSYDQQVGRVRGVSNSKIQGENTSQLSGSRN